MKKMIIVGVASFLVGVPASAQTTVHWSAPMSAERAAQTRYFPMGTALRLVTRVQLSTKDSKPGDRVYLEVAEPLTFRGQVIVPAGSVAVGEVAEFQRNNHFGIKGKISIRLLQLETPYGPVRIGGGARDEGTSGTALSVGTIAFVSPLGFLIHGTSANLPAGTGVEAHLLEDLLFTSQPGVEQAAMRQAVPDGADAVAPAELERELPARFTPSAPATVTAAR